MALVVVLELPGVALEVSSYNIVNPFLALSVEASEGGGGSGGVSG